MDCLVENTMHMIIIVILPCIFISLCWWIILKCFPGFLNPCHRVQGGGDFQILIFSMLRGLFALIHIQTFIDYRQYSKHNEIPGRYCNNNTVYSFNVFSVLWERKACKKITFHMVMFHDSRMSIIIWKNNFFLCTSSAVHFYFLTLHLFLLFSISTPQPVLAAHILFFFFFLIPGSFVTMLCRTSLTSPSRLEVFRIPKTELFIWEWWWIYKY